jgi:hypothetical protein
VKEGVALTKAAPVNKKVNKFKPNSEYYWSKQIGDGPAVILARKQTSEFGLSD